MQQAVEATEFGFDHGRQLVVLVRQRGFQVERDHDGLRVPGGLDGVVDLGQVGLGLAQQEHGGAVGGVGLGGGGADAATGAGDQDDPVLEQFGAGGVIKHKKPQRKWEPAGSQSGRALLSSCTMRYPGLGAVPVGG